MIHRNDPSQYVSDHERERDGEGGRSWSRSTPRVLRPNLRYSPRRMFTPSISRSRLSSGRISLSPRADVQDAHIEILEPMLTPGRHRVPNTDAYTVETSIAGSTLMATVHGPRGAFIRLWVVLDGRELALAVPAPRVLDIALPACIVEVLGELPYDPCVGWLHELVGTLGWAWVRQHADPALTKSNGFGA
jgi:hypothetical protein